MVVNYEKSKFLKLLRFTPLMTISLIATSCNNPSSNSGLSAKEKLLGDYVINKMVDRLNIRDKYHIDGDTIESIYVYQANTKLNLISGCI